ncbi:MAG: T9SS type A sorting domain-containing protein, partial [Bacteroidota bacterium]
MTWSINWDKAGSCGAGYEFAHYFDIIFGWRTDVSEDVNIKSNFLLFPNPSSVGETVYICSQEELNKIEIFDWLGRSIKPVNIRYEGSRTSFELNNHLSPGLYFIVCRTASGAVFGEKLIIE